MATTGKPSLAEVIGLLDAAYDPGWAQAWDAVGLVCGDPDAPVGRVLFAVDPVAEVLDEALAWGADLLVTHHPLLLRPVHGVGADTVKGRGIHRLITGGCALFTAHTNADSANPGVSDALAAALGLTVTGPILPQPGADPAAGRGLGRFGALPAAEPLRAFADRVAAALPRTEAGVRVSGDPDAPVRLVAVCGGSGDDRAALAAVRAAGADAYVTADLRHHPASEAREAGPGTALVDVAHWASEWPWLAAAARRLAADLGAHRPERDTVETRVSTAVTDPWTLHRSA
ncbi:MAG TPA: Nif3-like dinuclear metal center hexameric protein [Actinocrinis sp.]|nr:Nif3-like dinuclear metal center hexameric protein [Actinocrinis sp.]